MVGDLLQAIKRGIMDGEVRMEYYNPGDNKNRLRYEAVTFKSGASTATDEWTIRRLEWAAGPVAGDFVVVRIQVLKGPWDNRATLPWS
jgi:hypothetical protein